LFAEKFVEKFKCCLENICCAKIKKELKEKHKNKKKNLENKTRQMKETNKTTGFYSIVW